MMATYVTVSAKIRRDLWEKMKRYGINASEVIREAIERRVREEEIRWALGVMRDISSRAKLPRPGSLVIREHRNGRSGARAP